MPYSLPFREPYVTARGRIEKREMVLVIGTDEEGRTGYGEAVPLSLRGGASLPRVAAELERWGREAVESEEPLARAPSHMSAPARCAAEILRHDLEAKAQDVPLCYRLASNDPRGPARPLAVRCNATLTSGAPQAVAERALAWRERGFSTFKLKVGSGQDVEQVVAVREALGADASIRVDANGSWGVEEAALVLGLMAELDLEFAEQPVPSLRLMAELAPKSPVPLVADESVNGPGDAADAARAGACAAATVKLSKIGGLDVRLGEHLPTYLSSALDGPVGIAAAVHASAALPAEGPFSGVAQGLATQHLFARTIAAAECSLDGELISPPPGPGLGVEIDRELLDAHRLAPE